MSQLLITHRDCMDGSMCAVVWLTAHPDGEVMYVAPHEATPIEGRSCVFADVCPDHLGPDDVVLDHHTSALGKLGELNDRVVIDTSRCGCVLLQRYELKRVRYESIENALGRLSNTCMVVDDYDRWQLMRPASKHLARVHQFLGQERFVATMLEHSRSPNFIGYMNDFGVMPDSMWDISKTLEESEDRYVGQMLGTARRWWIPVYGGIRGGGRWVPSLVVLAEECVNSISQRVWADPQYDDVDMLAVVSLRHMKVSLRGRGRIDLAALAAHLGGGGHPDAGGFPIDGETLDDMHQALRGRGNAMGVMIGGQE